MSVEKTLGESFEKVPTGGMFLERQNGALARSRFSFMQRQDLRRQIGFLVQFSIVQIEYKCFTRKNFLLSGL